MKKILVAGIHTGIGKTICSAILCQSLAYDYWKPVQAGDLEASDTMFVQAHTQNVRLHPERYRLQIPASPHFSAQKEGITIRKEDFVFPATQNGLIIETAGGIMSPLSENLLNLDLAEHLACPIVLVSKNYLGSINHTLLTINALQSRKLPILGIIFNGEANEASEKMILRYSGLPLLFSVPQFENLNPISLQKYAQELSEKLKGFQTEL
jgi:dethiobiotin synthetase